MNSELTPVKIVAELDKYIVGQQEAKKSVAIALRNRWRRMQTPPEMRQDIIPNNILMIGPTGVGKTEIARRLAKLADAPFVKVEASKFTEVGYVGRDVESMVRDLVEQGINMVKEAKKAENRIKAIENAEERILDILIPPIPSDHFGFSFSAQEKEDKELNEKTREKFRQKIKNREIEDRKIEIEVLVPTSHVQVVGPMGMDAPDGLQDILSNMIPKKKKKKNVTIAEAREIFAEEEAQKLIDMELVTKEALEKVQNSGIIFIDEIDKVASSHKSGGGPDVSREGVQRDLLPIVEGSVVNTKYGSVKTDHILFIAAGAFHLSKPSDLIPEFQGRFPIRVELKSLTKEDFVRILTQPKNALIKQYQALLATEGVDLKFEDEAIEAIAAIAFEVNQEMENIGARRLHTILSNLLENLLFEVPDLRTDFQITITKQMVEEKVGSIVKKRDLAQYIL
ncbi:MAG: ATP-dependent protease ATPase subunit HslU [Bacteroidia bacterium]|nr:MAG: ATP-dependent protease ATPase subunit HslU [Bacteroidia bacterium]